MAKKYPNITNVCLLSSVYPEEVGMVEALAKSEERSLGKSAAILIREGTLRRQEVSGINYSKSKSVNQPD